MPIRFKRTCISVALLGVSMWVSGAAQPASVEWDKSVKPRPMFCRTAIFPTYANKPDGPTSAAVVALSPDGKTAVYADSQARGLGVVDLTDLHHPAPLGWMPLHGEPRAVVVLDGQSALVASDSGSFSGRLDVVDYRERKLLHSFSLPGQPADLALSPDRRYLAVTIENMNRESFPEAPPGSLSVFTLAPELRDWTQRVVDLTGLAQVHPEDPEPESVSINSKNVAAVTLQENNHLVLVDLARGAVTANFSAGEQKRVSGNTVPREPRSVTWGSGGVATADQGAWKGGGRSFTLYSPTGKTTFNSGDLTEQLAAFLGQYPWSRAGARGTEPECIASLSLNSRELLLVGCEKANLTHVFEINDGVPHYRQSLYSGPAPSSIAFSVARGLVVLGSALDDPKRDLRSYLSIYSLEPTPDRNHIFSSGIPWAALSGLTAGKPGELFTVADKALTPNKIFRLDVSGESPILDSAIELRTADGSPTDFDLEGIAYVSSGGFWLVAEGKKKKPSLLIRASADGTIEETIEVPGRSEKGLEGVAVVSDKVYVAFQSQMKGGPSGTGLLGRYDPASRQWKFAAYPLENEHFISGLSEAPGGKLAVLERDKKSRERSDYKRVFAVDTLDFEAAALRKKPLLDLVGEYRKNGLPVMEKIEGLAYDGSHFWVVNDNDAMKSSYGETVLLKVESPRNPK